jgi:hypothetical protein
MKTLLLILFTLPIFAQTAIGLQITQDNTSLTPDISAKIVLQGNDTNLGYLTIAPKYEWAQLAGGDYSRFGVEAGYYFHTNILKIDIGPIVGYGYQFRFDSRAVSWEFSAEIKIPITKNLSVISLVNVNQRHDLKNTPWRYNVGTGLRFDISTDYLKKQAQKGTRF